MNCWIHNEKMRNISVTPVAIWHCDKCDRPEPSAKRQEFSMLCYCNRPIYFILGRKADNSVWKLLGYFRV